MLVSKDINLRIKAAILGVPAEDYYNDRALDDLSLLYRGVRVHDEGFWEANPHIESWNEGSRTNYRIPIGQENGWHPNQCVAIGEGSGGVEAVVKDVDNESVKLQLVDDYYDGHKNVWGIHARNREQNFAMNLLMDPDVDFVTLMGTAGTGKTLLALAAGLFHDNCRAGSQALQSLEGDALAGRRHHDPRAQRVRRARAAGVGAAWAHRRGDGRLSPTVRRGRGRAAADVDVAAADSD